MRTTMSEFDDDLGIEDMTMGGRLLEKEPVVVAQTSKGKGKWVFGLIVAIVLCVLIATVALVLVLSDKEDESMTEETSETGVAGAFCIGRGVTLASGDGNAEGTLTIQCSRNNVSYSTVGVGTVVVHFKVRGGKFQKPSVDQKASELYCVEPTRPWKLVWSETGFALLALSGGSNTYTHDLTYRHEPGTSLTLPYFKSSGGETGGVESFAVTLLGDAREEVSLAAITHERSEGITAAKAAEYKCSECA